MTGLVMLGAIETNQSDVPLDATTPIATLITETEAIVVPAKSEYQTLEDLAGRPRGRPGLGPRRPAARPAAPTSSCSASSTRTLGGDPAKTKYVAHSGGGEANAAILSGSVDVGITGLSEVVDQVEGGKMRLLAVSSPVDVEIDGRKPPTIKDEGIDLEMTNWRAIVAPPGIIGLRARADRALGRRRCSSDAWAENVERFDWTPFVKTGDELDALRRVRAGARPRHRRGPRARNEVSVSWTRARIVGVVLLAIGVVALIATFAIPSARYGWSISGPRFAPLLASAR